MAAIRRRIFTELHDGREKVIVHTVQDVEPILKANRKLMNANGSGTSSFWKDREYVLIARIPMTELDRWAQQGLKYWDPDDWKIIKRMLNDGEYSGLRTAPGRF